MDVLFVAAEMAPYVRETAAAEYVLGLAKTLRQLGHTVTMVAPRHPGFELGGLLVARRLTPLALGSTEATVFDGQIASGVKLVLLDAPGIAGTDPGRRAALLGLGTRALVQQRAELGQAPDVVHAHDAAAALVPAALAGLTPRPAVMVTLHDASLSASVALAELEAAGFGLPPAAPVSDGRLDLVEAAVTLADCVSTTWPSQAEALLADALGTRLGGLLRDRGELFAGVPAALDYAVHNPATDVALASRFDAENPEPKGICKTALLRELHLPIEPDRPLAVLVGRIARSDAIDSVLAALPELLLRHLSLVIAGTGGAEPDLADRLARAALERPDALAFVPEAEAPLAHRCFAGADLALIPARGLPGGTAPLVAQRYGAFPVAAAIASGKDVVVDCDAELETGTGFLFDEPTPEALLGAVGRALGALGSPAAPRLRRRIMRLELGWDRPARRMLQLYRRATERPA